MYNTINGGEFMEIKSIDINYYFYGGFSSCTNDGLVHIKSLPYLSIVQSKIGSYSIKIDDGATYNTGDGNFFIAPSVSRQEITHYLNKEKKVFSARYMFLDIIINKKYRFDDVFDMPVVLDEKTSFVFNKDFDEYERAGCVCDEMSCIYKIIKHLIEISSPKEFLKNDIIYPLTEFIKANYMNNIKVEQMAKILKMSESNLYAVFKKATGVSPVKYLNDYRLAVAAELLLNTNDSIKTVAEKTGIDDQFYFSRLFKSKYRISPMRYKKERY